MLIGYHGCFDWIHESPVRALRILEGEEKCALL